MKRSVVRRLLSKGKRTIKGGAARAGSIVRGYIAPEEPGSLLTVEETANIVRREPPGNFLWLDRTSYESKIGRMLQERRLTTEEADRLRFWAKNGYVIIKGCVDDALIDEVLRDVDRAWAERWHLSIDVLTADGGHTYIDETDPNNRFRTHKMNDLYRFSEAVRKVFLHDKIVRFAELVFAAEVVGVNSLTFVYGSQQITHVDHVYMTPTPTRRLIASWIALEDVRPDCGPLEIWPGSHRLPAFRWGRDANPFHYVPEEQAKHSEYLASQKHRFPLENFMAKKGDVLLWHAMLAHGGSLIDAPSQTKTRKSMACHYFSRECYAQTTDELQRFGSAWFLKQHLVDPD